MSSGEAAAAVMPLPMSIPGNKRAIPGTIIHQMSILPAQMMVAYFKPMMYPMPNTAAPVLILKTSLAFSAKRLPQW